MEFKKAVNVISGRYPRHVEALTRALRPCVSISTAPLAVMDMPPGASRFGGVPDLPPDFDWPHADGRQLSFVAQLRLDELPTHARFGLPEEGWLCFFYDDRAQPSGIRPADRDHWRVVHFGGRPGDLTSRTAGGRLRSSKWQSCIARFSPGWSLPAPSHPAAAELGLELEDDAVWERYMALLDRLAGIDRRPRPLHQLFGYARPLQHAMVQQVALVAAGIDLGSVTDLEEPVVRRTLERAPEWELLLQLDSDSEGPGWSWADAGRLYVWLSRPDRVARSFDRAWLRLQSH